MCRELFIQTAYASFRLIIVPAVYFWLICGWCTTDSLFVDWVCVLANLQNIIVVSSCTFFYFVILFLWRAAFHCTGKPQTKLSRLVLWATHRAGDAQQSASLVRSSNMTFTVIRLNLIKLWHYRPKRPACCYAFCQKNNVFSSSTTELCTKHRLVFNGRCSPADSCFSVGKMRGQQMKFWLEQSCSSRGKRRWSGSRRTWPKGCPGPTFTLQTRP